MKKLRIKKVPPRVELGFQESESYVITTTLWNHLSKIRLSSEFKEFENKMKKRVRLDSFAARSTGDYATP
jgi:hypothetical protein